MESGGNWLKSAITYLKYLSIKLQLKIQQMEVHNFITVAAQDLPAVYIIFSGAGERRERVRFGGRLK